MTHCLVATSQWSPTRVDQLSRACDNPSEALSRLGRRGNQQRENTAPETKATRIEPSRRQQRPERPSDGIPFVVPSVSPTSTAPPPPVVLEAPRPPPSLLGLEHQHGNCGGAGLTGGGGGGGRAPPTLFANTPFRSLFAGTFSSLGSAFIPAQSAQHLIDPRQQRGGGGGGDFRAAPHYYRGGQYASDFDDFQNYSPTPSRGGRGRNLLPSGGRDRGTESSPAQSSPPPPPGIALNSALAGGVTQGVSNAVLGRLFRWSCTRMLDTPVSDAAGGVVGAGATALQLVGNVGVLLASHIISNSIQGPHSSASTQQGSDGGPTYTFTAYLNPSLTPFTAFVVTSLGAAVSYHTTVFALDNLSIFNSPLNRQAAVTNYPPVHPDAPLEERLAWICHHPLIEPSLSWIGGPFSGRDSLAITVDRAHVLRDTWHSFATHLHAGERSRVSGQAAGSSSSVDQRLLTRDLTVSFSSAGVFEKGVDYGGLAREWLQLLCVDMVSQGFLVQYDNGVVFPARRTLDLLVTRGMQDRDRVGEAGQGSVSPVDYWRSLWFFENDAASQTQAMYLFGVVAAKALFDTHLQKLQHGSLFLTIRLPLAFYKIALGHSVTVEDLVSLDFSMFTSLKYLLNCDITDLPEELCFAVNLPSPPSSCPPGSSDSFPPGGNADASACGHDGSAGCSSFETTDCLQLEVTPEGDVLFPLKPGGGHIMVTNSSKAEYVALLSKYWLCDSIASSARAFSAGLHSLIPDQVLAALAPDELCTMLQGEPCIDVDDWVAHTTYGSEYSLKHPTIQLFWQAVRSFSASERAALLAFITGSSAVPMGGFAHLRPHLMTIECANVECDHLPMSHTCAVTLVLPAYQSYGQMKSKLKAATENCGGFGFY